MCSYIPGNWRQSTLVQCDFILVLIFVFLQGYKLSVHVNDEDDAKQLCVSHVPSMLPDECRRIGLTIQSEHLSIEKLLMQTIEVRTRAKLKVRSRLVLLGMKSCVNKLAMNSNRGRHCQVVMVIVFKSLTPHC